ncbi:MAG: CCA tRNA nucleotidyltransferase [Deltaproteobacteria bacterium]|nr:CCA tRNA nucleotidyltransferase [Deltaproteobacteria bacterium]
MIHFNSSIFSQTKGAYIIGGSIRDLLLDRIPTDYDIAVTENPKEFAENMAKNISGRWIKIGKPGQTIIRVVSNDHIFDITSLNGAFIEDDLKKRDFTINAMAYDLSSKEIIDCLGGLRDLADKKVRMVSADVFKKDPIRLMRAYRIGACLNFEIESQTASSISTYAKLIHRSAGERIREEIFKLLGTSKSYHYISQMADAGLLSAVFPDLDRLKGCFQNSHHLYDAFEHTLKAYLHLETILNHPDTLFMDTCNPIRQYLDKEKTVLIKYAILLHDLGKPWTKTIDNRRIIHFYGHSRKSADLAQKISQKLRLSNREKQFIDFIIRNHLHPLFLFTAMQKKTLTHKGITRFFKKCGDNTPALLLHAIADSMAKQDQPNQTNEVFMGFVKEMMHQFFYSFKPKIEEPPLITGRDLIHEFGLMPSPEFKTILNRVQEEKLTNQIKSRSEALAWVRDYLMRGSTRCSS